MLIYLVTKLEYKHPLSEPLFATQNRLISESNLRWTKILPITFELLTWSLRMTASKGEKAATESIKAPQAKWANKSSASHFALLFLSLRGISRH